jgi:DNA-directed RNA polymerase specialized sigma24 family protein
VARASAGDQGAWDQLVDRTGGLVRAVTRARGLCHADASEVSQVTWLLFIQHLDALQQPQRVGSWLLRTATHEAYRRAGCATGRLRRPTSTTRSARCPGVVAEVTVAGRSSQA